MANILEDIGRGLRIAGGVSSPRVAEENERRRTQFDDIKAKRSEMILQLAARAAESGSITPEAFQTIAQKYGVEGAPAIGPSIPAQQIQQKMQQEGRLQKLRGRAQQQAFSQPQGTQGGMVAGVDINLPEPETERQLRYANSLISSGEPELVKEGSDLLKTLRERPANDPELVKLQDARARAISIYGRDHQTVKELDAAIARKTAEGSPHSTQYERALETLRGLQLQVESGKSLTRDQELQAQSARTILEQQRPVIDPATGKLLISQPVTVPQSITVGGGGRPTPNVLPSLEGGRRPLDAGTEKKFTDIGNGFKQLQNLTTAFKPDYAGFVSETAGQLAIQAGRRGLPAYGEMANFWQQYEQWVTDMRAAKFGMTLTGYELEQFRKYISKPSDKPDLVQKNMQRQIDLVNAAAQRELKGLDVSGQNVKQGEALSGLKKGEEPEVRSLQIETEVQGVPIYSDKEKEKRYQQWKKSQDMK